MDGSAYGDARECIRAAKSSMRQVKDLLATPTLANADHSAAILREVEVQLGCAAAILKTNGSKPDLEMRSALEELQEQAAVLARFFAEADKLLSGWLKAVRTRRGGYTGQGHAAPLELVSRMTVEG